MSLTPTATRVAGLSTASPVGSVRRVRHQARDVALLMAFSATTSLAVAGALLLVAHLPHAGR